MADLLKKLNRNPFTGWLVRALGLPNPVDLARHGGSYEAQPLKGRRALLCRSPEGYAAGQLACALAADGAAVIHALPQAANEKIDIVVMDATGCTTPGQMRALYDAFHPVMPRIARNGRVLITAPDLAEAADAVAAATARGVEGFCRSLGKELGRKGITANLAYVQREAADRLDGLIHFFCGKQAAYVSGQAVTVTMQVKAPNAVLFAPMLPGKVALVTGAARGIGLATAERLAQEGATVICADVPAASRELDALCSRIGGMPLELDIAAQDAAGQLAALLVERFGGVDIVVHNAGITRDKTLGKMDGGAWDAVLNVNFAAIAAIDRALLSGRVLRDEGRIVCLSSISGVAGNFGQTNYAATKAALIGYVAALAPAVAARGITVNAVAPGFIETAMVAKMPFMTRELGRRLNSVQQGGLPRDVAELITFLCTPGAHGITGNTIRVCGQGLIGA
ncbi:3-oxoacyl-ACP reductase [Pseudoduganella ginsengisoli]|uniref:3-oxoacyl-ACP reductase n=1 Tax=Pseudoduganella ginsengisoli TaxID=1462440 RepID=A0A6L6Q681_9BURK|nr:3-oxoacyl-ACP reductase [Pseudoduganella ginsengisoli]MTW04748.1 3-oxoacyl-ACP reductase [Pseudoduganella ginsengisoli]